MPIYEMSSDPSPPMSRCCSFCFKPHSNAIQSPPPRKNQTYQPHPPLTSHLLPLRNEMCTTSTPTFRPSP